MRKTFRLPLCGVRERERNFEVDIYGGILIPSFALNAADRSERRSLLTPPYDDRYTD